MKIPIMKKVNWIKCYWTAFIPFILWAAWFEFQTNLICPIILVEIGHKDWPSMKYIKRCQVKEISLSGYKVEIADYNEWILKDGTETSLHFGRIAKFIKWED